MGREPSVSIRVQHVMEAARAEAARLGHSYIGTEHLLLGLALDEHGMSRAILDALQVRTPELRMKVEGMVEAGAHDGTFGELPLTSRAKAALEQTRAAALRLGHDHIGTEHLLIGLAHGGRSIASHALAEFGVTEEIAEQECLRLVGHQLRTPPGAT